MENVFLRRSRVADCKRQDSVATVPYIGIRRLPMPFAVTLDDKYVLESGRVYLTGTQALVRLPMMQRQRDLAAGLNTAGYISGYRGSPLGGFDQALWQAKRFIKNNH